MKPNAVKAAQSIKTAGLIRPLSACSRSAAYFYGVKMIGLPTSREPAGNITTNKIKQITNSLHFYNQVAVRISLDYSAKDYNGASQMYGHEPDVKAFAQVLIDRALQKELDREVAIMARGENIAANQHRQRMLGKYLLSKPYSIIRNFYGVRMQRLTSNPTAEMRRKQNDFHSDIIHEHTSKTVHSAVQTQIERIAGTSEKSAAISDSDLNRIAAQAAQKVEKKLRTERERNGKW